MLKPLGSKGMPEEEVLKVHAWCERARLNNSLLEGVLAGLIVPRWHNGDVHFRKASEQEQAKFREAVVKHGL
jgi:hypothetical protein